MSTAPRSRYNTPSQSIRFFGTDRDEIFHQERRARVRAVMASVLGTISKVSAEKMLKRNWPDDAHALLETRVAEDGDGSCQVWFSDEVLKLKLELIEARAEIER